MARTKVIVASARTGRIAKWCDQISLVVHQRCIEADLPRTGVDFYVNDLFNEMVRSKQELDIIELLQMLLCEEVRDQIFDGYASLFE